MTADSTIRETYETIRATEAMPSCVHDYDYAAGAYDYTLPQAAQFYGSVGQARRAVTASGSHYFDASTLRYWGARSHGPIYECRFWVESRTEPGDDDAPRTYQVAWISAYQGLRALSTGPALSIEKLGSYDTLDAARRAARRLADAVTASEVNE